MSACCMVDGKTVSIMEFAALLLEMLAEPREEKENGDGAQDEGEYCEVCALIEEIGEILCVPDAVLDAHFEELHGVLGRRMRG